LGTNLNKFAKSAENAASVILTNAPDAVTQAGTPFSVENMNHMEEGIYGAHEALDALPFGYILSFPAMPSAYYMSLWRLLPLQGGVYEIAKYQRLCDKMYVGNAANATADWWYKTSDSNGTVRDVNGAYMRVLDHRGLFPRAAGQNSKYKMANDAPYDGKSIGAFIGDAIRQIFGAVAVLPENADILGVIRGASGALTNYLTDYPAGELNVSNNLGMISVLEFNASRVVPTAPENRPASISAYVCIKY
jgi:hypothetical protein